MTEIWDISCGVACRVLAVPSAADGVSDPAFIESSLVGIV